MLIACQGAGFALNWSASGNLRAAGQGVRVGSAYHFKG